MGSITETIAGNTEAGTIFYTTTVNLKFHKLAATMQQEMKKVAAQRLIVFALGIASFAFCTYWFLGEALTMKTYVSLALAVTLCCVQVFWKV